MSKSSLHGHTKIELFNAGSGKLEEVVEDDNTLTGALAEIFQGIGNFANGSSMYQYLGTNAISRNGISYSSANYNMAHWFGGLLAFNQDQDESNYLMSKESDIVAAGVYGYLNGGSNQVRGSYNSTESEIDMQNKSMHFVYDFATNQGNGTIRSVCLTPRWGGFMNEGLARTMTSIDSLPVDEYLQPFYRNRGGSVGNNWGTTDTDGAWGPALGWLAQGLSYHTNNWGSVAPNSNYYYINNSSYMGIGAFWRILEIDPDNNCVVRAKVELSAGTIYLTIERFPLAGNEVDVWFGNGANSYSDYAESTQIELGNALYNHIATIHLSYDYELRKLYIVSHPLTSINIYTSLYAAQQQSHRNGFGTSNSFTVWEIDIDPTTTESGDTYTVTEYTIPNNTNSSIMGMATMWNHGMNHLAFHCYEGYIYVLGPIRTQTSWTDSSSYNIYKIELENPANVVQIDTNITSFAPVYAMVNDAHDGRMYLNFGSSAMRVLNTRTNQLYAYEELNASDYTGYQFTPIRNHTALGCSSGHLIGVRPNVLMTVNNITAVTKTSAQTMKISYTISG